MCGPTCSVTLLLSPSPDKAKQIRDCLVRFTGAHQAHTNARPDQSTKSASLDEEAFRHLAQRELMQLKQGLSGNSRASSRVGSPAPAPIALLSSTQIQISAARGINPPAVMYDDSELLHLETKLVRRCKRWR